MKAFLIIIFFKKRCDQQTCKLMTCRTCGNNRKQSLMGYYVFMASFHKVNYWKKLVDLRKLQNQDVQFVIMLCLFV